MSNEVRKDFRSKLNHSGAGRAFGETGARLLLLLLSVISAALLSAACSTGDHANSNASSAGEKNVGLTTTSNTASMMANTNTSGTAGASATRMRADADARYYDEPADAENYSEIDENPFREVARAPLSTFSVDVDTASYSNTRRFINDGQLPPKDAVRVEELINYFSYDYPQPAGTAPFSVTAEVGECPWNREHRLVHIGLQGRRVQTENLPPANLVFLIDVSGSMDEPRKLPLLKSALRMLAEQLTARDRVAVVVYAGTSGLALPSTPGDRRSEILGAINRLEAGGSTNGGEGIQLAYRIAQENFIRGGTNRVVLAIDGDFNVGVTNESELVRLIEEKRRGGVSLSVLGFGTGNLNDSMMEKLADKGDGNYAYIDTSAEARKALGEQVAGTLVTIAKDVKIQVEFNPRLVAGYRLIGYENRLLRSEDFNDDAKDAGEIGAGHTVTALYEVVPAGRKVNATGVDKLKYQEPVAPAAGAQSSEMLTVKLRYKEPAGRESQLVSVGVADRGAALSETSENFRFSAAVAAFGMLLRDSKHRGDIGYDQVLQLARDSTGADLRGYRREFISLAQAARTLAAREGTGR
ncbi:MAG TPA: VWA domain-containing protein [Pyrinomonadaceae bacterium]|nr:VWA domain-containing protein [Pyrinomonadaceae bacterium]